MGRGREARKSVVCALIATLVLPTRATADGCPNTGEERVVVAAVAPRGELKLTDGRLLRLAGFDPALATPGNLDLGEQSRTGLADKVAGKTVEIRLLAKAPDRWGRLPAFVFVGDGPAGGVATQALAAGLGRYLAEPAAHACRAELIGAETAARQAKLGLWADPYYGVLAVDDRAGFTERLGTIVLAEGTVSAVQPSPFRTTLRFAAPGQDLRDQGLRDPGSRGQALRGQGSRGMLVATILPRVSKTFQAQQIDVSQLLGKRLRVRGLLDMRFGPRIELNGPDDLEVLDQPGGQVVTPSPVMPSAATPSAETPNAVTPPVARPSPN